MLEDRELTPEEKAKLKKILIGIAIFAGAYLGAKHGVNKAMKEGLLRIHLVHPNGMETVLKNVKQFSPPIRDLVYIAQGL